jgi:hypothetical protein
MHMAQLYAEAMHMLSSIDASAHQNSDACISSDA